MNPSASGIHLVPYVREAQKRGAKLVVIDPRTTPLARAADIHLAVRPGTDVAVALAIHRYLFENGHADEAFLREHTTRRRALRERARAVDVRARRAESPASIADALERVAQLYAATLAGADPLRLGTRAQPQRRQRGDGGAGAAGGRRQVRRARRRLLDEQLGVVGHRAHLDRRAGAADTRIVNMNHLGRALTDYDDPPVNVLFVYNCNPGGDGRPTSGGCSAGSSARTCSPWCSSR